MDDMSMKGRAGKKLTAEDVRVIRAAIANGNSNAVLAADFNVTPQHINLIRKGKLWKFIK